MDVDKSNENDIESNSDKNIGNVVGYVVLAKIKQLKNSREGRCVTRMFLGPVLVDRMMGG